MFHTLSYLKRFSRPIRCFERCFIYFLLLLCVRQAIGASITAETCGQPDIITLVNYSPLPVYATSVQITENMIKGPFAVSQINQGNRIPFNGLQSGNRLYLSLAPTSRVDLSVSHIDQWPRAQIGTATEDDLCNRVVRFKLEKNGWTFGFDAEKAQLLEFGQLDFWVDSQNRGRITNSDPDFLKGLGLLRFGDALPEKPLYGISKDGSPFLRRERRVGKMRVTETFELVSGQALLICRVDWKNEGAEPLWVAYVGSGTGVSGRWSRQLLPDPLIQRKKFANQGFINGSETRCAWIGGLCRMSMESPETGCGVGMSTLLPTPSKIGQGSMIWGCGRTGYQLNFIDPVQGQFPFRVEPGGELKNGFVFLAAQAEVSVFRETLDLWNRLQAEKPLVLLPACAVFVNGEPICPQTVTGIDNLPDAKLALKMDFNRYYELQVSGPARIVAVPFDSEIEPVIVVDTAVAGRYTVNMNDHLPWKEEVAFTLENPDEAILSIREILPVAPVQLSPVNQMNLTHIAAMFRWKSIPLVTEYELQWSSTPDFLKPTVERITSGEDYPWYILPDEQLPSPGQWFWRIRGHKGQVTGVWSDVRTFTVNDQLIKRQVKRALSPDNPLFTIEASKVTDFIGFDMDVPSDIAPFLGIIAEGMEFKGIPVNIFARGLEKLPHGVMLRSHWVGLADIEWLFQNVPNFIGIQGGEHLSSLYRDGRPDEMLYHHRLIRLCAKYGMIYQEADGTYRDDKWQELMDQQGDFVREYGPYLVLSQKNNIIRRQFYSQSAAMGLWLGDIIYQHGAWEDGGFYWQNAGFDGLGVCRGERSGNLKTTPRIFWSLVFAMGIARGCTVYSMDGQTLMFSPKEAERFGQLPMAIWDTTGKTSDTFKRFVVPLIRATVQQRLIPSKNEVLNAVRLAVYNDKQIPGDEKTWTHYVEYGPLYAGTYGFGRMGNIDGQLYEFFPNTGRYYYIPVLPQGFQSLAPGIRTLPVSELQRVEEVRHLFNSYYPDWYEGDALVNRAGDTLVVLNTHENQDVPEHYAVTLEQGLVRQISGTIEPHSYLLTKCGPQGKSFWLQANTEYSNRPSVLVLSCARKPDIRIVPRSRADVAVWNPAARILKLTLSHEHGAVEVDLK